VLKAWVAILRVADVAERSEADEPGHDQVDGDEVIEKAWENQHENPHDGINEMDPSYADRL
jgi:hypothetical protein